jgi:hypothetical protein
VRKSALSTNVFLEGRSGSPSAVDLTIEHGGDDYGQLMDEWLVQRRVLGSGKSPAEVTSGITYSFILFSVFYRDT